MTMDGTFGQEFGRRKTIMMMLIITIGRALAMLVAPAALLVEAILWAGPGSAWPMGPMLVAGVAVVVYVVLTKLFVSTANHG